MKLLIIYIVNVLILGLFLYSKLLPYKDKLNSKYKGIFDFFNKIFSPIFIFLRRFVKPFQVGAGLAVDLTHVILLVILLIILNIY